MAFFEALFLLLVWAWIFSGVLFLRNTFIPRLPVAAPPANLPVEPVSFPATDGVALSGWKVIVDPSAPWVILCHGLGTNRSDLLHVATALFQARYNLLLFDFRAHGQSQGRATSFGWVEQRDLEGALAFLGAQPEAADQPYGVFGVSMGGAVAIMVAARDERLGAVAVDSIYADLQESIGHHLKLLYRLPRVPFLMFVSGTYRLRFGAWPGRMSPRAAVGRISPRPLLVIHGEHDLRMPLPHAKALFEAARDPKTFVEIPLAGHLEGMEIESNAYLNRLVRFFDASLKP